MFNLQLVTGVYGVTSPPPNPGLSFLRHPKPHLACNIRRLHLGLSISIFIFDALPLFPIQPSTSSIVCSSQPIRLWPFLCIAELMKCFLRIPQIFAFTANSNSVFWLCALVFVSCEYLEFKSGKQSILQAGPSVRTIWWRYDRGAFPYIYIQSI